MDANSSRWHEITPSAFAHERAALEHVRELLPDRHPYQAWSNFTFISDQGHIREVDLLVAAPTGLFLVEIKNFHGRLTNHYATWIHRGDRSERTLDNPLPLADQKAKELKSLLGRAASREHGIKLPFVRAVIFFAEPGMVCDLDDDQRHHLYGPDTGHAGTRQLPKIGQGLLLTPVTQAPPQPEFFRALGRLLKRVGIHRTKRSISVGQWRIEPKPYGQGPTWQDHHASREDIEGEYRRIRIYLYERESDPETRESIRNAARREFSAGRGVRHPGLLMPNDLVEHEMGPALIIEQESDALRLDHYMAQHGAQLDLPARLGLVRQLAEAVRYAHDRRLVHRALSPRAVIVERAGQDWDTPKLRVGEWQTAARGLSSTTTRHQVKPTTHAGQHVELTAAPYLAPEFAAEADGTVAIDVFGLGSTAYLILTGQPPALTHAELMDRLTDKGGLHPAAVSDAIPDDIDALIALATDPRVTDRFADVEEFLEHLDEIPKSGAEPEPAALDPWEATKDTELPDGYVVLQVLGTGATARAFHVTRDGLESVLKVGRSAQAEERLADEAAALEGLRHEHLVMLKRGVFPLGGRHAIELDHAGQRTLAQVLREDGALLPDQLQRFGDQLLDVLNYLHSRETFHRDIKPDNLGVRTRPKRGTSLVLFDFSLAGAPPSDVQTGTRGYRDPFLGTDRRPSYDDAAERYAAAVTLHEMASRELPTWGEDGTDPRFVDEVTLSSELFDSALREPLIAFFRRALHPDAEQRFLSVGAMREAWRQVFAAADAELPATSTYSDSEDRQEQRDELAERATPDTALDASGLTMRAVAVAQRLGASTVGDLIDIPTRRLWQARGLPKTTRTELVARAGQWRRKLAGTTPTRTELTQEERAGSAPSLDAVVGRLIPAATRRNETQPELTRMLLGLPDEHGALPSTRWPTLAEVAETSGLTAGRIAQVMGKRRREWSREPTLTAVREDVAHALSELCRVAAATELADQLLLLRGCAREEDHQRRRAYAYAVLRAAVEADSLSDEPRFAVRRHADRVLIALQVSNDEPLDTPSDGQLLDLASGLADEAVRLAAGDPLPTPAAVVRTLAAVASRVDIDLVFTERRLVQLAAAASGSVLANARLELYPYDMDPARALRLAQAGAGVPKDGVTPDWFDTRMRARFPGLPPLPTGRQLSRLLTEAGVTMRWDGTRFAPPDTSLSGDTSLRRSNSMGSASLPGSAAADVAARLTRVVTHGGVRVVTARRPGWARCRSRLAAILGVPARDVSSEFVGALRAVATERKIPDFSVVLRADAADADSRARTNLQRVVAAAFERLEQQWSESGVLLLDGLTPLGRYPGGTALLERLAHRARRAG
ncbi:MAG: BREX system serine/threonine kinase PglW, partial [Pseudonocardiaceae bacterium]